MTRRPARAGAPEGGLVVDKSAGLTSHDVVALARRALSQPRIGHTGTLDPLATGVLPLLLGRATRLARFLVTDDKAYEASVRFGQATTTYDAEGAPSGPPSQDLPDRSAIEEALTRFRGRFDQIPPAVSAKKVGGHRAYALARAARPVTLEPVPVEVSRLELTGFDGALARLSIECSSGFYVRSLAHDLGAALGVGAHVTELRRTRSGLFCLEGSVSIAELSTAPGGIVPTHLITMGDLLCDLPARALTSEEEDWVRAGRDLTPLAAAGGAPLDAGFVRLLAADGRLAAVAEMAGGVLHPLVVLM